MLAGDFLSIASVALAAAVAAFCVGTVLIRFGFRGRAIDHHPLCRRCGFDLIGKPSDSHVCSECGAVLGSRGAIRVGHRVKSRGAIAGGVLLYSLSLLIFSMAAVVMTTRTNWQQLAPLWLIERQAVSNSQVNRAAALAEIGRRLSSSQLSKAEVNHLMQRALAVQGDRSLPWDQAWGNWIESVYAAGTLAPQDRLRYARQAVPSFSMRVRSNVARGDDLPVSIGYGAARVGGSTQLVVHQDSRLRSVWVDDLQLPKDHEGSYSSGGSTLGGGGSGFGTNLQIDSLLPKLKDGKHTLRLQQTLSIRDSFQDDAKELFTVVCAVTGDFNLLAANEPSTIIKADPTARPVMDKAISISKLELSNSAYPSFNATLDIGAAAVPVAVGYDVIVRAAGREWPIGSLACPAGTSHASWGMGGSGNNFPGDIDRADVILRPSTKAAAGTVDTFEIWDGPITFKDVKIVRR